jgi:16S rRNA (cytidine1402-2'-O)-methyltransferase
MLKEIVASKYSVVLYESKHRMVKLLTELEAVCGRTELEILVARELTKMHESFYQGTIATVLKEIKADINNLKGEFVVLIKKE